MKRSAVIQIIASADVYIRSHGFHLPPFAYFTPDQPVGRRHELLLVFATRLGWDITDFGAGRFDALGLFLFTTHNGQPGNMVRDGGTGYAENIMFARRDQITPCHRHIFKTKDIISRGSSTLAIEMFESNANRDLNPAAPVSGMCDGFARTLGTGDILEPSPGESITLQPGSWHTFWGKGGDVLIGEVSTVNDDETDNMFADSVGRFSAIEEDCPPTHLLVSDYANWSLV